MLPDILRQGQCLTHPSLVQGLGGSLGEQADHSVALWTNTRPRARARGASTEHRHALHEAGRVPGYSSPGHTLLCSALWLVHTFPDAQLLPRSWPHFFPSQVLPILSVSNQLALALCFIRGLKKLGFSLEFIKAEWSGACRPPLPVWRAWAPHPHLSATTPCPAAGSRPGGPEEEARRVTL